MLDAPILMTSWFTPLMDKALERMALATSMYFLVEKLGLDVSPPRLSGTSCSTPKVCYFFYDGNILCGF